MKQKTQSLRRFCMTFLAITFLCQMNLFAAFTGTTAMDRLKAFVKNQNELYAAKNNTFWLLTPDALVWTIALDDQLSSYLEDNIENADNLKQVVLTSLSHDLSMKSVRDMLVEANLPLEVVYVLTSKEVRIPVDVQDLKNIVFSSPSSVLQGMADAADSQCPQEIEEGLVLEGCKLNSKYITYTYSTNSAGIEALRGEGGVDQLEYFKELVTNSVMQKTMKHAVKEGVDIRYLYYDASDPSNIVSFIINCRTGEVSQIK